MKRAIRPSFRAVAGIALALGAAAQAAALSVNPRGLGEVLIYPYYTANAGFGTLVTIVNTTAQGKALKVRFHEGYNGRAVAAFNLYLSPFDTWVGQVFDTGTGGDSVAALATNDHSCVAPSFLLPVDPGSGPPRINFDPSAYSGVNADGGPTAGARTREGYFDVIEMGELTNATHATLTAITHVDGVPPGCAQIAAAWTAPDGYWTQNGALDLAPPAGGLYGAASIINVAAGLMYTVNATAIDGFSTSVQHGAPDAAIPDLNTASPNAGGGFAAFVPVGAKLVETDFTRSEDAISALFMADSTYNEYVVDAGLGAQTDWVVTAPTKRFYTDSALLGGAAVRAPFDAAFGSDPNAAATSCSPVRPQRFSREELTTSDATVFTVHPSWVTAAACYATSVFSFQRGASVLGSSLVRGGEIFPSVVPLDPSIVFASGHGLIDFTRDSTYLEVPVHALQARNGVVLRGLPVLGFAAIDYVNGNVTPGVLANYSGAYPHHGRVTCFKTANPDAPCD